MNELLRALLILAALAMALSAPFMASGEPRPKVMPAWCLAFECGMVRVLCPQVVPERQAWCKPGPKQEGYVGLTLDDDGNVYLNVRGRTHNKLQLLGQRPMCGEE